MPLPVYNMNVTAVPYAAFFLPRLRTPTTSIRELCDILFFSSHAFFLHTTTYYEHIFLHGMMDRHRRALLDFVILGQHRHLFLPLFLYTFFYLGF